MNSPAVSIIAANDNCCVAVSVNRAPSENSFSTARSLSSKATNDSANILL